MKTLQFIDGKWLDGERGWNVVDPSTEEVVANVPYGGKDEVNRAIDAAHRAFPKWRDLTPYDRAAILMRAAAMIRERATELGKITTREAGKPIVEAVREWPVAADLFEFYAEEGKRVRGYSIASRIATKRQHVRYEPVGVVGVITAWNFPAYNPARAVAAALAAGCTVVVRPSELTPLSMLAIAEILEEAGIPPGVVNVVNGDANEQGQAMLDHPDLRKLSFTGSVRVGKLLMDGASRTMTRLSLELGGNAPVLVLPDADIEAVGRGAVAAKFRNAGQVCVSPQRFFVASDKLKRFEEVVVEETRRLKVGVGADPDTRIGPMITNRHRERVEQLIATATDKGAKVRHGGRRLSFDGRTMSFESGKGYFLEPTILGEVPVDNAAFSEETFGPLFMLTSFTQLPEAIRAANSTRYGLAAYVFTDDLRAATLASEQLEFGMVGVNDWSPQGTEVPFPGRKESGVGHECGREGLYDNLETKLVTFGNIK
jgi:acyl-CoA reductase-like NAD-dependent aldehyde dehydrogenase